MLRIQVIICLNHDFHDFQDSQDEKDFHIFSSNVGETCLNQDFQDF